MVHKLKQGAARIYLNTKIKAFGYMTNLDIDTKNKTIKLSLELKGETQPIQITVSKYNLVQNGSDTMLELGEITATREWINELLAHPEVKIMIKKALVKPVPNIVKLIL
jgi:hypothetical protein